MITTFRAKNYGSKKYAKHINTVLNLNGLYKKKYLSFVAGLQSILDETAVIVQTNPFGCDP